MKISFKILIPTAIMLILAVTVLSLISYTSISAEISNVMGVATGATLDDIDLKIQAGESERTTLKGSLDRNFLRIARSIAILIEEYPPALETDNMISLARNVGVDEIHVVGGDGVLFAGSVPGFFGFDFSTNDQTSPFLKMLKDKSFELAQEPSTRAVDGVLFQYIGVPFTHRDGLVQIGVQPKELQDLLARTSPQYIIENYSFESGGYAYIIDPKTRICTAHRNKDLVGTDMSQFDFANRIVSEKKGEFTYVYNGLEVFTSFRQTDAGIIVAAVPTEFYREGLATILIALIVTSLGALIILMVLMMFIVGRIVAPLGKVSSYLEEIAAGDLTILIEPALTSKKDETGDLARSLKNMAVKLRGIVREVSDAASKIAIGSQQVSDSSQQLSTGATEQAANAEEVSSSMEEMSANISQNADNSSQTEKIAIQAAQDARDSSQTVGEAVQAMNLIANKINIIEEISRSTNLLALNAAIEAARAGEQGKGFAVVAAEVRKLAEQSQKAAGEITTLAGRTMALSHGSGEKLNKLVPGIERTAELVEEISAASSEQQSGVDQISRAIHQLDSIIQSNASSSEELAATSETLAIQAEQLKKTIDYFNIGNDTKKSPVRPATPSRKPEPKKIEAREIIPIESPADALDDDDFDTF